MLDDTLLSEACLLIFANKQDLENPLSAKELEKELELENIKQKYHIQPCCAVTGDGIYDGLNWLAKNVEYYF
jgi:signal recognition particle receptor subunit beta